MHKGESRQITPAITLGGFDQVKALTIGGGFPVAVQTMWKDRLTFAELEGVAAQALIRRIENLGRMGCALLRFAVPDMPAAEALGRLSQMVSMPLVADIHFDYKIALRCMDFSIAKIRINPGNIGSRDKVCAVLEKAAAKNIPIRIGLNAGSLPQDLRRAVAGGMETAEALVLAAEQELAVFAEFGFKNVLVSMKASGIADTIKANRMLAGRTNTPLHIGVTEAGPLVAGIARSSAALAPLLAEGLGDTLRVSLSDTPENEVIAGREILGAAAELSTLPVAMRDACTSCEKRLRQKGVTIVSCPRCGRYSFDTHSFTERWMSRLYGLDKNITVAVMGCAVNGPGEAKHADLGITGAGDKVLVFRRGKIIRTIAATEADAVFEEELTK